MAYATPLPDQDEYDRFYRDASAYGDVATSTGSGASTWDERRLRETAAQIAALVPDKTTHIVDVGCGAGGQLRAFAELGYGVLTGIDLSPACVRATDAIPGVRGCLGSLFAIPEGIRPAGIVVLSHVLEHVRDVGEALDRLATIVGSDGRVYAEVPDACRYTDFLAAPFLDFNTEHINHFSEGTLRLLFALHGFDVVASGTKTIASSPTARYPCAWVFAHRSHSAQEPIAMTPDRTLRSALERYISASQALLDRVTERCRSLDVDAMEVIVWGTGQTTAILLAETPLGSAHIRAFTDSNPVNHGRTIAGVRVLPPEELRALPQIPIVIGSLLHAAEIARSIAARGLENPIIVLDPRTQVGGSPPPNPAT